MRINGKTKTICLLGNPTEHSFSPYIHNYLFKKYNQNNTYVCFNVLKENLEEAIKGIKALGIEGCNVTIPYKVDIMKYLDDIDNNAKLIGSINTIKNESGKLIGYNTDGIGFVKSITDKGYSVKDKKIIILGAGGACRSIAVELAYQGAKEIDIRNRSIDNSKKICDIIDLNFEVETKYSSKNIEEEDLNNIDIIINTTPIGMDSDFESCPIDENLKTKNKILVCDIVYNPHETKFIKWAKNNNLPVIYGVDMLINQAIHGFYIWTGINVDESENIKDILKGL